MKWQNIIALITSTVALVVSLLVGWYTSFKPAHIVGCISYIVVWRFSSNNDGVVTDTAVTPAFWLRNAGARPTVIKDLRLVFVPKGDSKYETYPTLSVPLTAIENSTEVKEYGRIASGAPFRGFSLTASEQWTPSISELSHTTCRTCWEPYNQYRSILIDGNLGETIEQPPGYEHR